MMLSVCNFCNRTRHYFPRREMRGEVKLAACEVVKLLCLDDG